MAHHITTVKKYKYLSKKQGAKTSIALISPLNILFTSPVKTPVNLIIMPDKKIDEVF